MADAIVSHAPRFLVLRGGAIGDFIVTLPVLQALRARWPSAHIEIWGYPTFRGGSFLKNILRLKKPQNDRFEPLFGTFCLILAAWGRKMAKISLCSAHGLFLFVDTSRACGNLYACSSD